VIVVGVGVLFLAFLGWGRGPARVAFLIVVCHQGVGGGGGGGPFLCLFRSSSCGVRTVRLVAGGVGGGAVAGGWGLGVIDGLSVGGGGGLGGGVLTFGGCEYVVAVGSSGMGCARGVRAGFGRAVADRVFFICSSRAWGRVAGLEPAKSGP